MKAFSYKIVNFTIFFLLIRSPKEKNQILKRCDLYVLKNRINKSKFVSNSKYFNDAQFVPHLQGEQTNFSFELCAFLPKHQLKNRYIFEKKFTSDSKSVPCDEG